MSVRFAQPMMALHTLVQSPVLRFPTCLLHSPAWLLDRLWKVTSQETATRTPVSLLAMLTPAYTIYARLSKQLILGVDPREH